MSRSKKDWNNTESMLTRLTNLLVEHDNREGSDYWIGRAHGDAESLRRISMTLHRWHELECGDGNEHGSWCITRGRWRTFIPEEGKPVKTFEHDDDEKPFLEYHHYTHGAGKDSVTYSALPDREAGAKRRLATVLKRYPGVQAYIQTDPRGSALYMLPPGSVKEGEDVSSVYSSRGIAVFK